MIKAPYNFVPLAETVVFPDWADKISMDVPFKDGISGTIDVKYTAQTPLFIGNGKVKGPDGKDTALVENYKAANGQYAIPGSSLRGMIRNIIEIASFSKFSRIDDSILSVRDLQNPKVYGQYLTIDHGGKNYEAQSKAGWLVNENGGWFLYPVNYHRVEDELLEEIYNPEESYEKRCKPEDRRKSLHNNPIVYFKTDRETTHRHHDGMILWYSKTSNVQKNKFSSDAKKGYTVLTGQPGRTFNRREDRKTGKHMDFIFEEKNSTKIQLSDNIIQAFSQANPPNAANQQKGLNLTKELRDFKHENYPGIPVFYLADSKGNPESLGLSQMYRLPYRYTLKAAALHSSELHGEESKLDFTECIFGKINNNYSLRGRIQFEDALGKNVSLDAMVTTILGNPKPTFYPTYIEQNPQKGDYTTLMDDDVRLRGWKRYPVRNEVNPVSPDPKARDIQISKFTPLKKGSDFEGKIHFHNLKPQELGALIWAITWNDQKNLSHSIGMGKPYGYGQIKAEIKNLSFLENSNITNNYTEADYSRLSSWEKEFEDYMVDKLPDWKKSPQLKELFAMANPENATRSSWVNGLTHMLLALKEFVNVKKAQNGKEYLAPYSYDRQNLSLAAGNVTSRNYSRNNDFSGNRNGSPRNQQPVRPIPSEGGVANGSSQLCVLLDEKTKKGGWKAKVKINESISGVVINTQTIPSDKCPGDEITLKVKSVKGNNSMFEYVSQ